MAAPSSFCQNTSSQQQARECIYVGASLLDESIAPGEKKKFPTSQFHIDKNSAVRIIVDLLEQRGEQREREGERQPESIVALNMIKQSDNRCKATFASGFDCHFVMNVKSGKKNKKKNLLLKRAAQHILIASHSGRACKCTSNLHNAISSSHYVVLFHAILSM